MDGSLTDKCAIITGASQGFGFIAAKTFLRAGANLLLCARGKNDLEKVREELLVFAGSDQKILTRVVDVSNKDDVIALVETAVAAFKVVHILMNNAGIYGPMGAVEDVDWDEWKKAIEINLYGSVLMCRALLPHFKENRYGKIIQLSGGGATAPMPRFSAYAASKVAVVRFIETLAEEVREYHIDANAIAPGALNTRLLDEVLAAGPEKVGAKFYNRAMKQKEEGGADIEKGAALALFLASSESDGLTGKLVSSIWDPWENFLEYFNDLTETDIYTLRRITPKERKLSWGDG